MPFEVISSASIEHARGIASGGGHYLVVDPVTLARFEAAEAAGALSGGMTGNADGAPYSAQGYGGPNQSSAGDPAPLELLEFGALEVLQIEDLVEKVMDAADVVESWGGKPLGPMILVPTEELRRWLYGSTDGA